MSGRQLRRRRWGKRYTVGGSGKGSEEVVEEGKEERRKKTEGRPPSGLIKSITFSFESSKRFAFSFFFFFFFSSFSFSSL